MVTLGAINDVTRIKKVLVLAPHTDDGELGCGASIARFVSEGAEVYYAAFSTCEQSIPQGLPKDILEQEMREAIQVLGISQEHLFVYGYPVRRLSYYRQEVLEDLTVLRNRLQPDLVLLPSSADLHQDHQVLAAEGMRAFRKATVLGYEEPWNHITFSTQAFIRVEEEHLEAKLRALKCYQSQTNRRYFSSDFIRSLAIVRGVQAHSKYAEAFEVIKIVL